MLESRNFELPENCTGRDAILRHLDRAAASVAESISTELGTRFEGRALASHRDFGGYRNWKIEVLHCGKVEATVSIEWNEVVSPTHCCISIADAEEYEWVPGIALGLSAALGAVLGSAIAPGTSLAFALGAGATGYASASLWMRVAARVRPRRKSEAVSLLETLTRQTAGSLVPA